LSCISSLLVDYILCLSENGNLILLRLGRDLVDIAAEIKLSAATECEITASPSTKGISFIKTASEINAGSTFNLIIGISWTKCAHSLIFMSINPSCIDEAPSLISLQTTKFPLFKNQKDPNPAEVSHLSVQVARASGAPILYHSIIAVFLNSELLVFKLRKDAFQTYCIFSDAFRLNEGGRCDIASASSHIVMFTSGMLYRILALRVSPAEVIEFLRDSVAAMTSVDRAWVFVIFCLFASTDLKSCEELLMLMTRVCVLLREIILLSNIYLYITLMLGKE
jgi:hypothetical protein